MKISLQDADVRAAVVAYIGSQGFDVASFDCTVDFMKARKSGEVTANIEMLPKPAQESRPEPGPLDFDRAG